MTKMLPQWSARHGLALMVGLACLTIADATQAGTLVGPGQSATVGEGDPVETWTVRDGARLNVTAGGATARIFASNGGQIALDGSTVSTATGLALELTNSTATIAGAQISSSSGVGLALNSAQLGDLSQSRAVVTGSVISAIGRGLTTSRGAALTLSGSQVIGFDNGASGVTGGGVGANFFGGEITANASSFVGDKSGIVISSERTPNVDWSTSLTLDNSTVEGKRGSAIVVDSVSPAFQTTTTANILVKNGSSLHGGNGTILEVNNGNTANLTVDSSTLSGNIFSDATSTTSVVMQNSARLTGRMTNVSSLTMADSQWTITGDSDVGTLSLGNGSIAFQAPTSGNYKTLTVRGDFSGNGGTLRMNTELGDDRSGTDKLHVQGSTSGQAFVQVNNVGGLGAQTLNGIQLIQVDGASNGEFNLSGRAVGGAYEYFLHKGSRVDPGDGDWYLRSELPTLPPDPGTIAPQTSVMRPEVGAYLGNQAAATGMFMHTLHDRLGEPGVAADLKPKDGRDLHSGWARVSGSRTDSRVGDGQLSVKTDSSLLQVGADLARWGEQGRGQLGVMASIGRATIDSVSDLTGYRAKGKVDGKAVGIYGTWYAQPADRTGLYVDGWLQYSRYSNSVQGNALADERYSASAWQASAEAGYAWKVHEDQGSSFYVEPQAQVIFTNYRSDAHREFNGTVVDPQSSSVTSRLGVRMYGHLAMAGSKQVQPFVTVNWWRRSKDNSMSFDGVQFAGGVPQDRFEIKAGAQLQMGGGWTGWGQLGLQTGKSGYRSVGAQLGARYSW